MSVITNTRQYPTLVADKKRLSLQILISNNAPLFVVSLLKFLIHMLSSNNYGFFFDEFLLH